MPPKAKATGKPKKVNGYQRPAEISLGTVLTDTHKNAWKVGPSIGSGGFGDIYSCCNAANPTKKTDDYPHVVKIEPHANGPLFVEMHFYARNCKKEEIEKFRIEKGLKHLGMPHLISHGSQDINGERHRFLVIPKFGTDIWKLFLKNNRRLPEATVYRIGIQMLNVLEYMHSKGYVHADIKGANILLGLGKAGAEQCYLVDFGLANHYSTKEYKPDPKNAHNGTIEYTSRDAHNGVSTMRGDFEILGLNLVHWLGLDLPWESQKLLANPKKVQESKEAYMKNLDKHLSGAPEAIKSYMKYVEKLRHDETPDYDKCRGYLERGLKALGKDNRGPLQFEVSAKTASAAVAGSSKTPQKRGRSDLAVKSPPTPTSDVSPKRRKTPQAAKTSSKRKNIPDSDEEEDDDVENDSDFAVEESPKRRKPPTKRTATPKSTEKKMSKNDSSVIVLDSPTPTPSTDDVKRKLKERRAGNLVVNNELTPKTAQQTKKAKKTYEFNFELDVSIDADVVVNVKRKGKKTAASAATNGTGTPGSTAASSKSSSTPRSKVLTGSTLTPSGSPITPVVRKRIARNVKVTPQGSVRVEKG